MTRAVWSFWSRAYEEYGRSSWRTEWHHALAWGLSLAAAAQHYPDTCLVTDDEGARFLIDELQLPFRHVSTALQQLRREDPEWWALGKVKAYSLQETPFVHVDTDVFLWNRLAPEVEGSGILAQHPEVIVRGASCYQPEDLETAIGWPRRGWLPPEWIWYGPVAERAECCGIFGGNRVDFIRHYADSALRLVLGQENRAELARVRGKIGQMILAEQYLLTACFEYHRSRPESPFRDVTIGYVFDTPEKPYQPEYATEAGYTHLASGAKKDDRVCRHLEVRVRQDLPDHYERCLRQADKLHLCAWDG